MPKRVRVRRERPSALSWAIALAVTMLAVYFVTLSAPAAEEAEPVRSGRVTRELTLAGAQMYFASLGSYPNETEARIAAALVADRGAAGCVYGDGEAFHVLGAGYAAEADAQRIAAQLTGSEGMEAETLFLSAPEVVMRVTAPEADVDTIACADRTLREQIAQAGSMALQVDRGELSVSAARMLASVSEGETRNALERLGTVNGAEEQPVCAGLMRLLARLAAAFDAAAGESAPAALSGRLRLCQVDGNVGLIAFLNGLYG